MLYRKKKRKMIEKRMNWEKYYERKSKQGSRNNKKKGETKGLEDTERDVQKQESRERELKEPRYIQ